MEYRKLGSSGVLVSSVSLGTMNVSSDKSKSNHLSLFESAINNGVNYIESQTSLQMGVKNSPLTRYPYPYFNPTTNMQKTIYDTEYKWMFDFADNHSGFGRNVASSP
jgi:hypothetical protein